MTSEPLVITADSLLVAEAARLAAASGITIEECTDAAGALRRWQRPPLILVGADLLAEVASLRPPRRDDVYVVGWGTTGEPLLRAALEVGAETMLELPSAEAVVAGLLADIGDGGGGDGLVVGVVAGSGGAGATTYAAALASLGADRGPTLLVDADRLGPGAGRVLALEEVPGVSWGDLGQTAGRLGARALREAVPHIGSLGVLGWPSGDGALPRPEVVREVLAAARRGHDLVVVDLPRESDASAEAMLTGCDVVLVVVRADVTGTASAARLISRLPERDRVRVVVRGRAAEPEAVGRALGLPVVASMSDQRGLAEAIDLGLGPIRSKRAPLARAAAEVLARCKVRVGVMAA
ncbi:secretion/DNA translocation related CpaE-like protein [Nocardioides luteus]|uniref:Septum formation initiator n=1 Tax=Nocardioides luteus TaxID=1844 RepID=A0ABQ5SZR2_9ACTN|nr:septum site-determining protein Ssd [Nocardioides luteus]MDR7312800.1 secretion/DNA translocation related CpaE-like protein [Nocardioides luteus]GGR47623.1 septum formation initiator [Nocardioides luteus]GLJ69053.1 septum formation initiator [Nocardioides luteus]